MTLGALLSTLQAHGVGLRLRAGRLQVRSDLSIPADLRAGIRQHYAGLLQLIATRQPEAIAARALIGALYRRVAAAWNPLPPAERPEAAYEALAPLDRALWTAYAAQDLTAVRRAISAYEQQAEPIFVAWRSSSSQRPAVNQDGTPPS
jgi:hypothetical protein